MLKLFKLSLVTGLLVLGLSACGTSSTSTTTSNEASPPAQAEKPAEEKQEVKEAKALTTQEFEQLYSDPTKFKGSTVDFYAQVFMPPEKDDKGTYFQAYADPKQNSKNTIVAFADPNFDVKEGDVLHIKGTVHDKFEGENLMGGKITAPMIVADAVEKADYATAFAPALKTVEVNTEGNQHGFVVKLNKVELAADETRVYMTVTNNMKVKGSLWEHSAKLVQGSAQVEPTMDFMQRYPKLNNDLLPAVTSEGVIVFPALKADGGPAKLYIEGYSDDFNLRIEPFVFDIAL